ncbi:hypothetical protein ACUWUW_004270 [Vibrio vulnificus]
MSSSDVIAVCSVFIAILALIATCWQAHLSRKHNMISAKPCVEIYAQLLTTFPVSIKLTNEGFGPAIITKVTLGRGGEKVVVDKEEDLRFLLDDLNHPNPDFNFHYFMVDKQHVLGAGKELELVKFPGTEIDKLHYQNVMRVLTDFEIDYECLYGKKYTVKWSKQVGS